MGEIQAILIGLQIINLLGVGGILKFFFRMEERLSKMEGYCKARSEQGGCDAR